MIKNYFTIAIRHLLKHKLFSLINIFCLAVGITFSLLIGIYILKEKEVNADLRNVQSQYILKSKWKSKDMGLDLTTLGPLPKTLREEYPHLVADYYRYNPVTNVISAGDKHFKENIAIGDTGFVRMYGLKVLHGNAARAFANNNSAVITETMAQKLFNRTNVIGERISLQTLANETQEYTVSSVLKDIPYNSVNNYIGDIYSVFVPTVGSRYYGSGDPAADWNQIFEVGMVELQKDISPKDVQPAVKQILAKYTPENIQKNLEVEFAPVKDYYISNSSVQKMITALSLVAIFILLMAIINFVNINIGISSYRLKEIGLRKVFGGARRQLVIQFLTEALLLTGIAAVFSVLFYELLRTPFEQILNTKYEHFLQLSYDKLLWVGAFVVLVGTIAGVYPAFVLSASKVLLAVKGKMDAAKGGMLFRRALLVVQFTLAIIVFITAINISKQVSYIFNKDIGYSKEQLMVITAFPKQWDSAGVKKMQAIKNGLLQLPFVKSASLSFEIPDRKPPAAIDLLPPGNGNTQPVFIPAMVADKDYASTFGMRLLAGSFFNQSGTSTPGQIVINEVAAKSLGLTPESAIGKKIQSPGVISGSFTVRGVINNYNYSSLQNQIEPVAFFNIEDNLSYRFLTLKLNAENMEKAVDAIKGKWKALSPDSPFEYSFMDDKFQSLYKSELQLKSSASLATGLNFIIVFMGIFGMVAFTLAKRGKEIAVRKVLGAEVKNILALFIKDYAWLILIANLIAWPLAYFFTTRWLQGYVYRINQDILPYILAAGLVFLATFVFISLQCFKAAIANPVKSLRTE